MRIAIIIIMLVASMVDVSAQSDRRSIRSGNRQYRQQNFVKAEAEYRKAVSANSSNPQALYNLGCALMMQNKDSLATVQFEKAGRLEKDPKRKAMVYHNIGFICQNHRLYSEAIEAYKESLRNNPSDNETRYNLELCKRLNKSNKQKQKQQNKQNKQNNDKKKDNKKKQEEKNKPQQQKSEEQKQNMSKDNAEQLLNAAMQNEQATQRKVKEAQRAGKSKRLEKNW